MTQHQHITGGQAAGSRPPGRRFQCPHCGARLRVVRRRIIRRRVPAAAAGTPARAVAVAGARQPVAARPMVQARPQKARRIPGGNLWWGGLALLVLALVMGEAFAANVPAQPPKGAEVSDTLTYVIDRSNLASRVTSSSGVTLVLNASQQVTAATVRGTKTADGVAFATVVLRDSKGSALASGKATLPGPSGEFSITAAMEPPTIPYSQVATTSVTYGK